MASSTTTALPSSLAFQPRRHLASRMAEWPWWVLFILLGALFLIYNFVTNATYKEVLSVLAEGVKLTVTITIIAYAFAVALGLLTALGQLSRNTLIHNVATLYVQIIRGVPILVQIFYTAFVIVPAAIASLNALGAWLVQAGWLGPSNPFVVLSVRDVDFLARGIIALAISYGAFSSEIFRAGIQSIERGQVEAGQALGLRRIQSLRLVILPQAIRRVLPPLGNDFIAMLKESSLVSVLGVGEITQLGKKFAAASFLYPETYNTAAFLYLSMTLVLSMGVRLMERRLKTRA